MSLRFKIYKHSRTISLSFVVVGACATLVLQNIYFKKIIDSFNPKGQIASPYYYFDELKKIKIVKKVKTAPIPKKTKGDRKANTR